jgi:hypothetical protein
MIFVAAVENLCIVRAKNRGDNPFFGLAPQEWSVYKVSNESTGRELSNGKEKDFSAQLFGNRAGGCGRFGDLR